MKRTLNYVFAILAGLAFAVPMSAQTTGYGAVQGFCQVGGAKVVTQGMTSSSMVQGSYPRCQVKVYATGTTTVIDIYSDKAGTHQLSNPFTAGSNGAWNFYSKLGSNVDVNMSGGSPTAMPQPFTLVDLPVGGGGGGGGGEPAGADQDVQLNLSQAFAADPGRFVYNPTGGHMLKSNANGNLNPDLYASTSGIAAAQASAECTVNCTVVQPITTTDTAAVPSPTGNLPQVVDSWRNGSWMHFWHNPGYNNSNLLGGTAIGHYDVATYDTPNPQTSSSIVFNPNHTYMRGFFNGWGWNYGNAPNVQGHGWMADNLLALNGIGNNQGILQGLNIITSKYSIGDQGTFYITGLGDGGTPDYSGEGNDLITGKGGQNSNYFHGTAGAGASTGSMSLPIVYNSSFTPTALNRNATSSGGTMLDMSKMILASTVTGPTTSSGFGTTFIVPIAGTVTPSTAYGVVNCALPNNGANPNIPISIRCPVIAIHGTAGAFVPGYAEIAGDFPEGVNISAVDPVGGTTQYITFTYIKPHAAGIPTVIFQGGSVVGSYLMYDSITAMNGFDIPYRVFGAPDANHLFVDQIGLGSGGSNIYDNPVPLFGLTKSGTTVTATYQTSTLGFFSKQAAGVVSGCSDSGLNGSATNITTDPTTLKMTFTEASGGTGCSGAYMQMPSSYRGIHLYAGAEVLGPGGIAAPANLPLEPNNVAWAAGDNIENALHPFLKTGEAFLFHTTNNPLSGKSNGISFTGIGDGVSGFYNFLQLSHSNPCSLYSGCGGTLTAPTMVRIGGYGGATPNGGFLTMDEAPLNQSPVIRVGPPDAALGGTSNLDPVVLFNIASQAANTGNLSYSPLYRSFVGNNFIAGSLGSLGIGKFTAANYFVNGYMNDTPTPGAITFGNNLSNVLVPMGLCDHYDPSNTEVTIGNCIPISGSGVNVTDGKINVAALKAQTSATLGNLTVGLQPADVRPASVYSGTSGSTDRFYFYVPVSPLGFTGTALAYMQVGGTAATLSASNKVTTTCPTVLQSNYPAGTTYTLLARSSAGIYRNLGTCSLGSSIVDDGTVTATFTAPTLNANMWAVAAQFQVANGGAVGFYKDNIGGALDTFINRLAVNKLGIGSSMGSAHDGTLEVGNMTVDTALQAGSVASSGLAGTGTRYVTTDSTGKLTSGGATGVTVSGSACTITAISNGIITAATCTP
jgi:hypothetical protein